MLSPARTRAAYVTESGPAHRATQVSAEAWVVAGLTILAAVLRFATISGQSFWLDEAQAVHEVRLSFGAMLAAWSNTEGNPPLYFIVGWAWAKLFGAGELGLRSFSAVVGTAVIPLTYLGGRELVSRRAGLVAAALAAVSPFMIWYSQEAREYMLLAALSGASLLYFARAWRVPTHRRLALWTGFSALALLTQYFGAFLVAAEAVGLLYRSRRRPTLAAVGSLAAIEAALIPHVLVHLTHQLQWVVAVPLSIRLQQLPAQFALNTLYYQSSIVDYSLLGAAALTAVVIALLVTGADADQLRGAALAAALAGAVIGLPLLLALAGHDNFVVRALVPAWIPLAVVIAAACTSSRARAPGAGLALVMLAAFVLAGVRIDGSPQLQRQDWRSVASALGPASTSRAIVAYDGQFATGPLSIYLTGVPWAGPGQAAGPAGPVRVGELDIVGRSPETLSRRPPGVRLIRARTVNGYLVYRFSLSPAWRLSLADIGAQALRLLGPAPPSPAVLIQSPSA